MGDLHGMALGAMEDLRDTAYAYHKATKEEVDESINAFFDEMDTNCDKRISFEEFKKYMKTMDCTKYGSDLDFFNKLRRNKNDYLEYCDVVTLLYIINSGRPFCERCERFIEGLYFTCVQCFETEGDYAFNFCPPCYYKHKNHNHCHEEFMDPISLLRLKKKQEMIKKNSSVCNIKTKPKPIVSKIGLSSSSQKDESMPSSNAIVVQKPKGEPVKADRALQLMQLAVGTGNLVVAASNFCSIM